jgi:high-affinity iron transporter
MLEALLVTFREGTESFLILGIIVAYLKKTDRAGLVKGVRIGLALSVVTCAVGAWLWLKVPNQPLYEGIAALVTAGLVGVLLIQMLRAGRQIKGQIERQVGRQAGAAGEPPSLRALAGVALVTTLLVTREGLEAVLYLGVRTLAVRNDGASGVPLLVGGVLGFVAAGFFAWSWTRWGHRLNLGVILKVTSLFLGLFLLQLVVYGIHELAESGVIHGSEAFHDATELFGPDGSVGKWLSYSLVLAPLVYLLFAHLSKPGPRPPKQAVNA